MGFLFDFICFLTCLSISNRVLDYWYPNGFFDDDFSRMRFRHSMFCAREQDNESAAEKTKELNPSEPIKTIEPNVTNVKVAMMVEPTQMDSIKGPLKFPIDEKKAPMKAFLAQKNASQSTLAPPKTPIQMPGDKFMLPSKLRDVVNPDDSKYDTLNMIPGTPSQVFPMRNPNPDGAYENMSAMNSLSMDPAKKDKSLSKVSGLEDLYGPKKTVDKEKTKDKSASKVSGLDDLYGPPKQKETFSWLGPTNLPVDSKKSEVDATKNAKSDRSAVTK